MIVVWLIVNEAHVATLATHPDFRRRGIAKRLALAGSPEGWDVQKVMALKAITTLSGLLLGFIIVSADAFPAGISVLLGVSFMSGTYVLTDTMTSAFNDLVDAGYAQIDVLVRRENAFTAQTSSLEERESMPESVLSTVEQVDGVARAVGDVIGYAQIVDPVTRTVCADDEQGEIQVAGPSVARGYWNRPLESSRIFTVDEGRRWLTTGDLGSLQDGELHVTGRIKDLLIVRGAKHFPQDLERTAERLHRGVRLGGVAAVAVGSHVRGDRVALIAEIDPREFETALENMFIVERIAPGNLRIRLAGMKVCEIAGMEVRGMQPGFFVTEADRGKVVVVGSHGGMTTCGYAVPVGPRGLITSDGGGGRDGAGTRGLGLLAEHGIPGVAVSVHSAAIGDGLKLGPAPDEI